MTLKRLPLYSQIAIGSSLVYSNLCYSLPLTLNQAIFQARTRSPDIRSLENQIASLEAKARQAISPSTPNFSLTYNDMTQPITPGSTSSTVLQLTQPIAFPGKAFLNRSVLQEQAAALQFQHRETQLQLTTTLTNAYYGMALALKNIEINSAQNTAFERILEIAKQRYETGSITQVDFLNSQVSLYSNQNDLADLEITEKTNRSQLNVLLGNPSDAALEIETLQAIPHQTINRDEAKSRMLENRPLILVAAHQAKAAEQNYKLSWMSALPDFQLSLGTTFYNLPSASPVIPPGGNSVTHTYLAQIQFSFPLWFIFNERETIISASHDRAAAEANLDSVHNQSRIALETSIKTLEAQLKKIKNYEEHLIPLAEQSFTLALSSYSVGKIDFATLSMTAINRRNVQRDYFSNLANYYMNYATFKQLIGEDN